MMDLIKQSLEGIHKSGLVKSGGYSNTPTFTPLLYTSKMLKTVVVKPF